ncbi:hypothetical protein, partial [Dactylosporangium darangshiense]|uniref:hypothetical protein n=1 Tax=Dactylosporangium darangshiense TaxID=579108 RepID=UPI0031E6FEFA
MSDGSELVGLTGADPDRQPVFRVAEGVSEPAPGTSDAGQQAALAASYFGSAAFASRVGGRRLRGQDVARGRAVAGPLDALPHVEAAVVVSYLGTDMSTFVADLFGVGGSRREPARAVVGVVNAWLEAQPADRQRYKVTVFLRDEAVGLLRRPDGTYSVPFPMVAVTPPTSRQSERVRLNLAATSVVRVHGGIYLIRPGTRFAAVNQFVNEHAEQIIALDELSPPDSLGDTSDSRIGVPDSTDQAAEPRRNSILMRQLPNGVWFVQPLATGDFDPAREVRSLPYAHVQLSGLGGGGSPVGRPAGVVHGVVDPAAHAAPGMRSLNVPARFVWTHSSGRETFSVLDTRALVAGRAVVNWVERQAAAPGRDG